MKLTEDELMILIASLEHWYDYETTEEVDSLIKKVQNKLYETNSR